jgi:serine/threonine protein kinase
MIRPCEEVVIMPNWRNASLSIPLRVRVVPTSTLSTHPEGSMMAAPSSVSGFLALLGQSGLLDQARLADYLAQLGTLPERPDELAGLLVRDGLLTRFQAEQLLRGRSKGYLLGQYRILDRVGAGGMGEVYLGEHQRLGRLAALKVLPTEQANDPLSLGRFRREAQAVAALDHPNIVHAYDLEVDRGVWFLALEYVEGADLQDLVARRGPLAIGRAADYARQTAAGLQHAFHAGLVHRDIKPANLLVARDGIVKILDMGLARFFRETDSVTREFDDRAILGTADYLAPEQGRDSHEVDIRADLYSLGATLFFLLTGRAPFHGGTLNQKLIWHQMKAPPDVRSLRPEVPAELAAVVTRLLAKNVTERFQTPAEVVLALAPWNQPPEPLAEEDLPPGRSVAGPRTGRTGVGGPRSSIISQAASSTRIDRGDMTQSPGLLGQRTPVPRQPPIAVVSAPPRPPLIRPTGVPRAVPTSPPGGVPVAVPTQPPPVPVALPTPPVPVAVPARPPAAVIVPTASVPVPVVPDMTTTVPPPQTVSPLPSRKRRKRQPVWLWGLLLLAGGLTIAGACYLIKLAWSNHAPPTPAALPEVPVPLGLRAKARAGGGVELEWLLDANGLTFRVERASDPAFTDPIVLGDTQPGITHLTDHRGRIGQAAFYRVAARTGDRQSSWSVPAWVPPSYAEGFRPEGLVCNKGAVLTGNVLQLTDSGPNQRFLAVSAALVTAAGPPQPATPAILALRATTPATTAELNQERSVFYFIPLDVTVFTTTFRMRLSGGDRTSEGITFCLQGVAPTQVGKGGGGLGYEGIEHSVAIKFDLRDNEGEGSNSTGVYFGGKAPQKEGSVDLGASGIDLHSGRLMDVTIGYVNGTLYVTIVDVDEPGRRFSRTFALDLPAKVGGSTAYAGFTASTSGAGVTAEVLSWTWSPGIRP